MSDLTVAKAVLERLGGGQFLALTGCKNLVGGDRSLSMRLSKNKSKANRMTVTLEADDTYTVEFVRETMPRLSSKTFEYTEGGREVMLRREGVYRDMLKDLFEEATGLYVTLYPRS